MIIYINQYNLPWETIFVSKDMANFHIDMWFSLVSHNKDQLFFFFFYDGGLNNAIMDNWEHRNVIYNYPFQISDVSIIQLLKRTLTSETFERIYNDVNIESLGF